MSRNPRAFMEIRRVPDPERDPTERVSDYKEIFGVLPNPTEALTNQLKARPGIVRVKAVELPKRP